MDFASNAHITLARNVQLREDLNKNSLPLLHQANLALRLMERVDLQESGRTQKQCITNAPRCCELVEPVEISMCKNSLIMGRYLEDVQAYIRSISLPGSSVYPSYMPSRMTKTRYALHLSVSDEAVQIRPEKSPSEFLWTRAYKQSIRSWEWIHLSTGYVLPFDSRMPEDCRYIVDV